MLSALQLKNVQQSAGEPLPTVWRTLAEQDTHFRRGQYVLIAAPAGSGKSAFVLTIAVKSGVPTFYFSADSDSTTQQSRMVSIMTGLDGRESMRRVLDGDLREVADDLNDLPIRFDLSATPDQDRIERQLEAYLEVFNEFPYLIVMDNITNVVVDGDDGDPFSGLEGLNDWLAGMARETQACVVGLHHVTGAYNDANKPIPMSGIKGQIGRVPSMIMTLFRPEEDLLGVSKPKDRFGKPDPSGENYVTLSFDGESMTITDLD